MIASFGAKCVVCGTSAVGTADADALPSNEKVNPAAPNADGGFGYALLLRSLLHLWHGRILRKFLRG
jgi:hypothetical protein